MPAFPVIYFTVSLIVKKDGHIFNNKGKKKDRLKKLPRDTFRTVTGRNRVVIRSRIRRRQQRNQNPAVGIRIRNRNRSTPVAKEAGSRMIKWLPILIGLGCGIGLFLLFEEKILKDELFFGRRLFESGRYVEYAKKGYLFYLIKIRGMQAAVVALFMGLHKRKQGLSLWSFITGFGFGIGGFTMFRRLGMPGILGYFLMIMPHYLCYLSGYGILWDIDYIGRRNGALEGDFMRKILAGLGVVIIGILLECYVNPFFIKLFVNLFL